MKDLSSLTKDAKKLQNQKQAEAGYKPGMAGQFEQMGDMIGQATEQVKEIATGEGENAALLAEGIAGQGVIVGMGTPARGASCSTSTSTWRSTSPARRHTASTTNTWCLRPRRSARG
jgi:hypothetical protein